MTEHVGVGIEEYFGELRDPRSDHTRRHKLLDIIAITVCAVVSGADDFPSVEQYGNAKSEQSERCIINWVAAVNAATGGRIIAVAGKQVRRSYDKCTAQSAICLVSAWATEAGVALGQLKVNDNSNEITTGGVLLHLQPVDFCTALACGSSLSLADRERSTLDP